MIGNMLKSIRLKRKMKLKQIAEITGINLGHLSHIERGDRNPSYKNLKLICEALNIPITEFVSKLDSKLGDEQEIYGYVNYIPYDKIPLVDIVDYVDVPEGKKDSLIAVLVKDDSMKPSFDKDSIVYIEMGKPVNNGDVGIFSYKGKVLIRKFKYSSNENKIRLEALNKDYSNILINDDEEFYIIGRII